MKKSFRNLVILVLALVIVVSLTACASDCELGKHTFEDISAMSATCTQAGNVAYKHCSVCDCYFDANGKAITQEQTVVPALGHSISEHAAIAPTCTQEGNIEYWSCSVCNKNFADQAGTVECGIVIVESLGHANSKIATENNVAPTCEQAGSYDNVTYCTACEEELSREKVIIDATGHRYGDWTQTVDPTCEELGQDRRDCYNCDHFETKDVDALGHDMNKGVVTTPVTSTTDGVRTYSCQRKGCDNTYTKKIEKLGDNNQTGTEPRGVDLYALNDFHGATDKLAKVGKYLKDKKDGNTVLLSSGDMFQETLESNWNYGALVNSCMAEMGITCMTIGNHEFDWGLGKLEELSKQTSVKFLGANIYHWDRNNGWGTFADEIADPYHIVTLENGLKVGIIGIIGSNQITSISANLVQTIGFKYPSEVVPSLATKLRTEENCDVVIVSIHNGASDTLNDSYLDMSKYADAVFCAHSHQKELEVKDGVPFIQGGGNGNYISQIRLAVDKDGNVSYEQANNISYSSSWAQNEIIANMVKESNDYIAPIANQTLVTVSGYFSKQGEYGLPRLVSKAMAEFAKSQGYDIDMAMINQARATLNGGGVTYTQLFHSLPFDNIVYIAEVSGSDLLKQANYGNFWRVTSEPIVAKGTYTIAVIDYVLFHQNSSRQYDYFPSAFENGKTPIPLVTEENPLLNYRDITKAYLLQIKSVSASDFTSSNVHCDKSKLGQSVTFNDAQIEASSAVNGALSGLLAW